MRSLGLDIGGANTKAVMLEDGIVRKCWLKYIPLWRNKEALNKLLKTIAKLTHPQLVGATLTGELCDIFQTKREGVAEIVEATCKAFGREICFFVTLDGAMFTREKSLAYPEKLAAANWVASTLIVGRKYPNCIFIDVGSTTTDIIPIKRGKPSPRGWTDLQRLRTGELVYTGVLRSPLPFICSEVSLKGEKTGVAAENFAIAADIYRILGLIKEEDYVCETPDGRKKDRKSCMQRIARVFCSDMKEIGEKQIVEAAETFHMRQTALVANGLKRVMRLHRLPRGTEIVVAGLGRKILAKRAVLSIGLKRVIDLASVYGDEAALMTPAFGASILATEALEHGRSD